jgi:hypothetical protein
MRYLKRTDSPHQQVREDLPTPSAKSKTMSEQTTAHLEGRSLIFISIITPSYIQISVMTMIEYISPTGWAPAKTLIQPVRPHSYSHKISDPLPRDWHQHPRVSRHRPYISPYTSHLLLAVANHSEKGSSACAVLPTA